MEYSEKQLILNFVGSIVQNQTDDNALPPAELVAQAVGMLEEIKTYCDDKNLIPYVCHLMVCTMNNSNMMNNEDPHDMLIAAVNIAKEL